MMESDDIVKNLYLLFYHFSQLKHKF